jgi:integrase
MTTLPKYLTQDELKRFFAAIESPRDRALFGLIYHYGLRVGEALMLTIEDVNFKNHRLMIRRLKNGLGGEKPMWRDTARVLRSYLRERRDVGPYLFTGRKGPLQKRQVQKLFNDYEGGRHQGALGACAAPFDGGAFARSRPRDRVRGRSSRPQEYSEHTHLRPDHQSPARAGLSGARAASEDRADQLEKRL